MRLEVALKYGDETGKIIVNVWLTCDLLLQFAIRLLIGRGLL